MPGGVESQDAGQSSVAKVFRGLFDIGLYLGLGTGLSTVFTGVVGLIGKYAFSFVDPTMAGMAGNVWAFAGIGAIAVPIMILPTIIGWSLTDSSPYLTQHPHLKTFLDNTVLYLSYLGGVTAAAAMLGTPLGATIISVMIVPTILYVLASLNNTLDACIDDFSVMDPVEESSSLGMGAS